MVAVVAVLKVQPGKEEEFVKAYKEFLPYVEKDPGTLAYRLHRAADDPTKFMFYEQYKTGDDLKAHSAMPEFRTFNRAIGPILDGRAQISVYNDVE